MRDGGEMGTARSGEDRAPGEKQGCLGDGHGWTRPPGWGSYRGQVGQGEEVRLRGQSKGAVGKSL